MAALNFDSLYRFLKYSKQSTSVTLILPLFDYLVQQVQVTKIL